LGRGVATAIGEMRGAGTRRGLVLGFGLGLGRTGIEARTGGDVTNAVGDAGDAGATSSTRSMAAGATLAGRDTGSTDARSAPGALPAGIPATSATPIPRKATTKPTTTDGHHTRTNPMRPMVGSRQRWASGLRSVLWTVRHRPQRRT